MNVNWTESAANQAKVILASEGDNKLNVRCFIQGGGCSGFQYGFTLDEQKEDYAWKDVCKLMENYKSFLKFDETKFKFVLKQLML